MQMLWLARLNNADVTSLDFDRCGVRYAPLLEGARVEKLTLAGQKTFADPSGPNRWLPNAMLASMLNLAPSDLPNVVDPTAPVAQQTCGCDKAANVATTDKPTPQI